MDKEKLITEWEKQIKRCEDAIERHNKNGFYDLAKEAEKMKKEAEDHIRFLR